ncbi:MAG: XdhC family protein [Longimicrobiales bacterium]|nr:XdhC family protein [Longimicrobiales bacterium]
MSAGLDPAVLTALREARAAGRRCALATVVGTRGSTPRKVGARLVLDPVSGLAGTVGGGCGEAEVLEAARRVLAGAGAHLVRVDLTRDVLSWSPAVCGGIMEVFVEAVPSDDAGESEPG